MSNKWFDELMDIKAPKLFALVCGVTFVGTAFYTVASGESLSYALFVGIASSISMAAFMWMAIVVSPLVILPLAAAIGILKPYLQKILRWLQD